MRSFKKIAVSLLTTAALSCTMLGTWAADVNTIKSCKISIISGDVTTPVTDENAIQISPEDMLKFEAELTNPGDVTLLSSTSGATEYNNGTIQYVAQTESAATITFRPRATLGTGRYDVKIGGTGVTATKTVSFTVAEPLVITPINTDVCDNGQGVAASYKIEGISSVNDIVVKNGETTLVKDTDYVVVFDPATKVGTVTINNSASIVTGAISIAVGGAEKTSEINVCPTVTFKTKNDQGNETTAYVPATGSDSSRQFSLKPVDAALSRKTPKTKVVSDSGYFKAWTAGSYNFSPENNGEKATYDSNIDTLGFAEYTAVDGSKETDVLTKAGAQRIVYLKKGVEQEAIRFIALVDNAENIVAAGFVVSDIHLNPTIEAGFAKSFTDTAYKEIRVRNTTSSEGFSDVEALKAGMDTQVNNSMDAIIFSVLDVNTDAQKARRIYATPYVQYQGGTRIYGETKAVVYNDLPLK